MENNKRTNQTRGLDNREGRVQWIAGLSVKETDVQYPDLTSRGRPEHVWRSVGAWFKKIKAFILENRKKVQAMMMSLLGYIHRLHRVYIDVYIERLYIDTLVWTSRLSLDQDEFFTNKINNFP